ncbi:MAG: hypothetical protein ACR2JO_06750 [Mycobacteriales bacterium]
MATDRAAGRAALGLLADVVDDILERTGLTEDELVAEIAGSGRR